MATKGKCHHYPGVVLQDFNWYFGFMYADIIYQNTDALQVRMSDLKMSAKTCRQFCLVAQCVV